MILLPSKIKAKITLKIIKRRHADCGFVHDSVHWYSPLLSVKILQTSLLRLL
jgi:hypothetical protein